MPRCSAAASGPTAPNHNTLAGTEQAKSWAVPHLAWTEGMFKLGASNTPGGYGSFNNNVYPQILTDVTDPGTSLSSVLTTGFQVPLWELVYHDALLSTQHWHLAHNKLLYCWDFADLSALIRGQAPMLHLAYNGDVGSVGRVMAAATDTDTGKLWDIKWTNPNVAARILQTYQTVCAWQGTVGALPMTSHQILSADASNNYLVQNSEFSADNGASGYGIVVNFGSYPGSGHVMTGATWSGTIRGNSLSVPVNSYATYTWNDGVVAAPSFTPPAGTYAGTQTVAIATSTPGATIRYTTDGSAPSDTQGAVYSAPISLGASVTLRAVAYRSDLGVSNVTSGNYVITAPPPPADAPVFSPAGGTYTGVQSVSLTSSTAGASIRYTTDGSAPSFQRPAPFTPVP
ncbi:MAG: chitobiase/beta-hexosaminidase C-terminal domain-containing protein [Nocardioides sp.]